MGTEIEGTYRIEERLGSGGFGTVYRVSHRFLGRMALKLLLCASDDDLRRLATEGAAHARLFHPHVTRVFDVNVTSINGERYLYIACEYMPLGDLESYLGQVHRLDTADWTALVGDVLSALDYAHSQSSPVLHRDIKPANILLGGQENLDFKLGDFGVSAEIQNREHMIARSAGTIIFQAPECAFGSYLVESDIYGAGVVLYRALTGTYPFPVGGKLDDRTTQQAKQDPPPPSRFRLDCSADLDAVLLRALAPDPFNRFRSAVQFETAVQNALASESLG